MQPASTTDRLVSSHSATVNGVRLHWVRAGRGPVVVLLHGFPEHWWSWRHQIPPLVAAGFTVVAPDLRGYHRSEAPPGVAAYRAEILAADVAALVEQLGSEPVALVGHDWGGVVAWLTAQSHPELLRRLVVLNAPHPAAWRLVPAVPSQLLRSAYIGAFQLPVLPEAVLGARRCAVIRWLLRAAAARPTTFDDIDLRRYADALAPPGRLTAALSYYRALRLPPRRRRAAASRRPVETPTLVVWGRRDPALSVRLADPGPQLVRRRRIVVLPTAGHFVHRDEPERVSALIGEFAGGSQR